MDMNLPERFFDTGRCRVCIVGGGFSGAVVALHLLEARAAVEIAVVEPRAMLGAGLAYSGTDPAHRVNVPAVRLLVHGAEPGAFHDWLETSGALQRDPAAQLADGRRYPRRAEFGRYVNARLMQAVAAPGAPAFRHVQQRAIAIRPRGAGYTVVLEDGAEMVADVVVLAVSHPPPVVPGVLKSVAEAPKFFADPWAVKIAEKLSPEDKILLIGTALSAGDVIGSLEAAGLRNQVVAVSRRGLVSRERRLTQSGPFGEFSSRPSRTCVALLRRARETIREAEAGTSCWEAVIEALRNQGDAIWAALPAAERARFLRHLRVYWDAHRYQLAPQLGATMRAKAAQGELRMIAARILAARHEAGKFHVTLRPRGGAETTESFDVIINCTGPGHAQILQTNPALASLAQAGYLRADPYGLGIETDANANPINTQNQPTRNLFVAGPLARAQVGELMGLPQVTNHAAQVAGLVAEYGVVGRF